MDLSFQNPGSEPSLQLCFLHFGPSHQRRHLTRCTGIPCSTGGPLNTRMVGCTHRARQPPLRTCSDSRLLPGKPWPSSPPRHPTRLCPVPSLSSSLCSAHTCQLPGFGIRPAPRPGPSGAKCKMLTPCCLHGSLQQLPPPPAVPVPTPLPCSRAPSTTRKASHITPYRLPSRYASFCFWSLNLLSTHRGAASISICWVNGRAQGSARDPAPSLWKASARFAPGS